MHVSTVVFEQVDRWIAQFEAIDLEPLARATGFQKRAQRKIAIRDLAMGVLAVVATGALTFERVAASIARRARQPYSKQALHKRLDESVSAFLLAIFGRCLQPILRETTAKGLLASFKRVLLHDSTTISLPVCYARQFPGSANQRTEFAHVKIQVVCDLLHTQVEHLSLSGFTRNDQRAAPDILELLRPGDLVIRDLGYFVIAVLAAIKERKAFFLSRYSCGTLVLDPRTQRPIPLAKLLKKQGFFDGEVLLGAAARLPVRLVAVAVSDAIANQRRRKLRQNRDSSLNPGKEHFYLLGWNIFLTNVAAPVWPAPQMPALYRLRWRIETLFKAWKSCLALDELNVRSLALVHLSIMARLIFCAFVYRTCHHIELMHAPHRSGVSIIRIARILATAALLLEAALLRINPHRLLAELIDRHAFLERRPDRPNFLENPIVIAPSLG